MKKTLTNLLLMAGLTTSSVAGPIELNKALTDESKRPVKKIYEDRAGIRYEGEMLIEGPDYKTSILATRFYPFHTEVLPRLNLNFSIYNDRTSIIISDTGANGMTGENGEQRDTDMSPYYWEKQSPMLRQPA